METTVENVKFVSKEEIQKKFYEDNDLDFINAAIRGEIREKPDEIPNNDGSQVPQPDAAGKGQEGSQDNGERTVEAKENEEAEKRRRYEELVAEQERKEAEERELEKIRLQRQIDEEKSKRYEAEKKARELELRKIEKENTETNPEDEFKPDYIKSLEEEIKNLKNIATENPALKAIQEKLEAIEAEKKEREKLLEIEREKKRQQEIKLRTYEEVENLQTKFPELKTKKQFGELTEDFLRFRKDVAIVAGCSSSAEADLAINKFFDPQGGEELRKKVADYGITPPEDSEKMLQIIELIDEKNGVRYDPTTQQYVTLKDSFGNPVRYASIEDVYKIKNFNQRSIDIKKQTVADIGKKLTTIGESISPIRNNETAPIDAPMSVDQIRSLMDIDVTELRKDPAKYAVVAQAYKSVGLAPPKL